MHPALSIIPQKTRCGILCLIRVHHDSRWTNNEQGRKRKNCHENEKRLSRKRKNYPRVCPTHLDSFPYYIWVSWHTTMPPMRGRRKTKSLLRPQHRPLPLSPRHPFLRDNVRVGCTYAFESNSTSTSPCIVVVAQCDKERRCVALPLGLSMKIRVSSLFMFVLGKLTDGVGTWVGGDMSSGTLKTTPISNVWWRYHENFPCPCAGDPSRTKRSWPFANSSPIMPWSPRYW